MPTGEHRPELYGARADARGRARGDQRHPKREHNEDRFGVLEEERLFIVADGMGGHACGEVASNMAVDTMMAFFVRSRGAEITWPYWLDRKLSHGENRLACAIKLANDTSAIPAPTGCATARSRG